MNSKYHDPQHLYTYDPAIWIHPIYTLPQFTADISHQTMTKYIKKKKSNFFLIYFKYTKK